MLATRDCDVITIYSRDIKDHVVYGVSRMPLTKQYLRYVAAGCFGVLCSKKCNVLITERRVDKKYEVRAIAPALENVIIWDLRREEKVSHVTSVHVFVLSINNSEAILNFRYFIIRKLILEVPRVEVQLEPNDNEINTCY